MENEMGLFDWLKRSRHSLIKKQVKNSADTEEQLFLADIASKPDDWFPRLVFADWLEEEGDPRAALIRVHHALEQDPDDSSLREREKILLQTYEEEWTERVREEFGPTIREIAFHRGLLEEVVMRVEDFLQLGGRLVEAIPQLTRLTILGDGDDQLFLELMKSEYLNRLQEFTLRYGKIRAPGIAALVTSPHLSKLKKLDLSGNKIAGSESTTVFRNSLEFPCLTELNLCNNVLDDSGVLALANSPMVNNLSHLLISCNDIHSSGVSALAESALLENLQHLSIGGNAFDDKAIVALANSPYMTNIEYCDLYNWFNDFLITDTSAEAIADSRYLKKLRVLRLGDTRIGDTGIEALGNSPNLRNLEELDITFSEDISHVGVEILAKSTCLMSLKVCPFDPEEIDILGWRALLQSPNPVMRAFAQGYSERWRDPEE